jgi:chaperone required for assembly of F1-ATPase
MAVKRFYKNVAVERGEGGYAVTLDGKGVRTPSKAALTLPSRALADAVAAEWEAQAGEIKPQTMPMTQLASTAIDRVMPRRDAVIAEIASYGETDLLCYRADGPTGLVVRQATQWQPMLDWAADTYDAPLAVTEGVMPTPQPPAALAALRAAVAGCDDFSLAALYTLTVASSSLVLALAVRDSALDPDAACDASHLDEEWQAAEWGRDPAAESRRERNRKEILSAAAFLALLQG